MMICDDTSFGLEGILRYFRNNGKEIKSVFSKCVMGIYNIQSKKQNHILDLSDLT